jgi:hypothetical protein
MMPVYIIGGLGLILLLTLIPLPKAKLRKTINKYVGEKENREKLVDKLEKSFIIKAITPLSTTMKYQRDKSRYRKAGLTLTPERMSIVKVVIAFIMFLLLLTVYFDMNGLREKGILSRNDTNNTAVLIFGGDSSEQAASGNSVYDIFYQRVKEEIPNYKRYFSKAQEGELAKKIAFIREELEIQDINDEYAKKIFNTLFEAYQVSIITPGGLGIIFCLSLLGSGVADLYINLKRTVRSRKVEKEFEKIEAVTILLMNKEQINVISLLQQMKQQSKTLKPYLQRCLNQYTADPIKALDDLVDEVNNLEFSKFITILKQCLYTDKGTNKQILEIQRRLRLAMQETLNKQRNRNKRLRLTMFQLPLLLILILMIMLPLFDLIKNTI